jgi:RHH-type proline utilization regulon transcriptional repressor/proline dehydrogenase/delta 1-pyrroline-5-carboxylate dehydrogenase
MRARAPVRRCRPRPSAGHFVPPTLIEIDRVAELEREVFGPVLHVLRYRARALPARCSARSTPPATA